jgi:hypothetical protein
VVPAPRAARGRARAIGQIVVRTLPAVVGLMLFDLLYDVLEFMDGDAEFETRMESTRFAVLYVSVLLGSVVLPATGAWLAARTTRRWVLHVAGFLPAVLLTTCYVTVEPVVATRLHGASVLRGVGANLVAVGMLYVFTAIGAGSIFCWALRAALRQLRGIGMMTSRSLPLLLLVTTFGFFTAEIWQAVGALPNNRVCEPVLGHLKVSLAARAAYLARFAPQKPAASPR